MIKELFKGKEERTVALNGSRYLVFPLKDISFRSLPNGSPRDISHVPAEGLAIVQSASEKGPLVYVDLTRLDGIDKRAIPVGFLYPNPLIVSAVRHEVGSSSWDEGPSIYANGAGNKHFSIHCRSERNYQKVQAEIYVERLLELNGIVKSGR